MSKESSAAPADDGSPDRPDGAIRRGRRGVRVLLADSGKLAWGFVSLNVRKTLFRLAPGRFACPCQYPSDSGRAWETECEAFADWHSAKRFRYLCPLLKKNPAGLWRCSVDTAQVRPFWGRALAAMAVGGAAFYAAATLAVYLLLHSFIGYPVSYASIAWPRAWHEIRPARARFFFEKAERAFKNNQPVEAIMWLSQSYELDRGNYTAGRILAQLWQNKQIEVSDRIYRQLLRDHPAEQSQTAQAWFLALLARGDFPSLAALAWDRLHAEPAQASVWFNAMLVACRRTGDTRFLQRATRTPAGLPSFVPVVSNWELHLTTAAPDAARALLTQPIPADSVPFAFYYRVNRLLHLRMAEDALRELSRCRDRLANHDRISLYLDAYAAAGWQNILAGQVDKLLAAEAASPGLVELLCAHLIRYPDPAVFDAVLTSVSRHPVAGTVGDKLAAYSCLFCAAGAAGNWVGQDAVAKAIESVTGTRYKNLDAVEAYFKRESQNQPIEHYLPAVPSLPVDVTLALYEFSDRQRAGPSLPQIRLPR